MAKNTASVLIAVNNDSTVKIGLPPRGLLDNYERKALDGGRLENVSHVVCSHDGEMFCIKGGDLYTGPLPSSKNPDWFSVAKRVGRYEWQRCRLLCFHPNGDLYVVSIEGDLYKGAKPENENASWFYDIAEVVGKGGWNHFEAVLFDPKGFFYAVTTCNELLRGPAPQAGCDWFNTSQKIGKYFWNRFIPFFGGDGKLWCFDKNNGNLLWGDCPYSAYSDFFHYAEHLARGLNNFKFLALTEDKTICNITSFIFLPEKGKKTSESTIVIAEKTYDNRKSTSPLKHTFEFSKRIMESSSFETQRGFTVEAGVETTFKAGIPKIAQNETKISISVSTTHNWNLSETNEREITISSGADVEIMPGKCVRMRASIVQAQLDVPFEAMAVTVFGYTTKVKGMWKGVTSYGLSVIQDDMYCE